jgi:hypothetical protein
MFRRRKSWCRERRNWSGSGRRRWSRIWRHTSRWCSRPIKILCRWRVQLRGKLSKQIHNLVTQRRRKCLWTLPCSASSSKITYSLLNNNSNQIATWNHVIAYLSKTSRLKTIRFNLSNHPGVYLRRFKVSKLWPWSYWRNLSLKSWLRSIKHTKEAKITLPISICKVSSYRLWSRPSLIISLSLQ